MKENIREGGVRPSGTLVAVSTEPVLQTRLYAPTLGYSRFPFSAFACLFLRRPFADFDSFLFSGPCALYHISITP